MVHAVHIKLMMIELKELNWIESKHQISIYLFFCITSSHFEPFTIHMLYVWDKKPISPCNKLKTKESNFNRNRKMKNEKYYIWIMALFAMAKCAFFACWFFAFLAFAIFRKIYFARIYVFVHRSTVQNHSLFFVVFFKFCILVSFVCLSVCVIRKMRKILLPHPRTRYSINLVAFNWTRTTTMATTATTTNYNLEQRIACSICWNRLELAQWECNLLRYKFTAIAEKTKKK